MKVGYLRVLTKEQKTTRQEVIMKELGVEKFFGKRLWEKHSEGESSLWQC